MKNYKENLFNLIRNEEVILFIGAGVSIYAGYPSGEKLKQIIYKQLTPSEKENISEHLNLIELTEQFFRIRNHNRHSLLEILNRTFLKASTQNLKTHHLLKSIPHFKTIITTNYDKLLEESYHDRGQLIFSENQIPFIDKSKVQIFKIHGDLSDPKTIIISQSDYNNFFKENTERNLFWSVIKERLTTKNVLFLGYNLEDPNVSVVFDKITDTFQENKKETYLVAPNLQDHKRTDLIRKGINYIDSDAESLIQELFENIKENIASDLQESKIGADTFNKFLNNLNLTSDFTGSKKGLKLKSIKSLNGQIEGKLNFTFKKGDDSVKRFIDFTLGKQFGDFELTDEQIHDITIGWGGIKLPDIRGKYRLKFIDLPRYAGTVDVRFNDGFQYDDFPIKVYGSKYKVEIQVQIPFVMLNITIDPATFPDPQCNFMYQHNKKCSKVRNEIKLFEFLSRLFSEQRIKIFKDSKILSNHLSPRYDVLANDAKFYLNYFNNLKIIESNFDIQFDDIDFYSIDNKLSKTVENIIKIITNGYFEIKMNNNEALIQFKEIDSDTISQLENINKNSVFRYDEDEKECFDLHGHYLDLGFKSIEIQDPKVINLEEVKKGKLNYVRIQSLSDQVKVRYSEKNLTRP